VSDLDLIYFDFVSAAVRQDMKHRHCTFRRIAFALRRMNLAILGYVRALPGSYAHLIAGQLLFLPLLPSILRFLDLDKVQS